MRAKRERKQIKQNQQLEDFIKNNNQNRFEEMTYNINHLYPDVNVIDMTTDIYTADNEDEYNNNLNKLKELTLDINNFVIILNTNQIILRRFFNAYAARLSIPEQKHNNVVFETELLLFRNSKAFVCPKRPNDEELIGIFKTSFR